MNVAPVISCQNFDLSPAIENLVRRRIGTLVKRHEQIAGCDVAIDAAQTKMRKGRIFRVTLNMDMRGPAPLASRENAQGSAQDDLILAVKRAFGAAEKAINKRKKMTDALS